MQELAIRYRNTIAILTGLGLGYIAGRVSFFAGSATGVLLFIGFIITPIPVCLIAARRWVWTSVVPVVTSQVTLLTLSYLHAYKPDGTDLQKYLDTRIYPHCLWWGPGGFPLSSQRAFFTDSSCERNGKMLNEAMEANSRRVSPLGSGLGFEGVSPALPFVPAAVGRYAEG